MLTPEQRRAIQAARDLITNIEFWTQGSDAADNSGLPVEAYAPTAYCFCAEGALIKVSPDNDQLRISCAEIVTQKAREMFGDSIIAVNDGEIGLDDRPTVDDYTAAHRNVLRVFDAVLT